jgi:2-oxoglutarate ferredoxin oxidoreductase subunit alpha
MTKDTFTYIVGGKAGEGVKKAGSVAAEHFAGMGRHVFQMDDYPSLIRGGHNFVAVSTAVREISSHYMKADLIVALDRRSCETHRDHLAEGGVLVYNSDEMPAADGIGVPMTTLAGAYPRPELRVGVSGAAALGAVMGLTKDELAKLVEKGYERDLENNVPFATAVYEAVCEAGGVRFRLDAGDRPRPMPTGNQAIALGAVAAGLDVYLAYPMTPATTILHLLAEHNEDFGIAVMHPESEIAVVNIAIGAAAAGARAMVGTSGGGFALMEEAFSLAGMAEVPLLCVLSSRPGPSTGVPTYTEQADLRFALNPGHGDFPRIVASPGSISEAYALTAEMMELVWRFQTPAVLLTEKHLSESRMTVDIDVDGAAWAEPLMHEGGDYKRYLDTENGVSPLVFPPSDDVINWTSYEHDELGITTEEGPVIAAAHDKRERKAATIVRHAKGMRTVNRFGEGGPLIFTYGSTTLSVLEALRAGGIDATVVQPVYLEPFPVWEFERYQGKRPIVVEQSASGQFANLIREKTHIEPAAVIRRYDGRAFDPIELAADLKGAMS